MISFGREWVLIAKLFFFSDTPQAVPEEDENVQEDDRSTVSFFSGEYHWPSLVNEQVNGAF